MDDANGKDVSPSKMEQNEDDKVISEHIRNIKLLNSKSLFLNATVDKYDVEIPRDLTAEEAKDRFDRIIQCRGRLDAALRTKGISRAVYLAFHSDDDALKEKLTGLLTRLCELDRCLHELNISAEEKDLEELEAREKSRKTAREWMAKKRQLTEEARARDSYAEDDSQTSYITKIIAEIERVKSRQGHLIVSCPSYDWIEDPKNMERYLASARKPPYKVEDFL